MMDKVKGIKAYVTRSWEHEEIQPMFKIFPPIVYDLIFGIFWFFVIVSLI